ncbi:MAG: ATP-binding protein, partial [Acidimicrobiia bacterium]
MEPGPLDIEPGQFYLGGFLDDKGKPTERLTYEAADLTTHGVIVGMTGSGKTGLAIDLLEEALLSGIPALIIDPKGDMTNLLLNFPQLAPSDFRPWIDESVARRQNVTPDQMAEKVAGEWREGLASWKIDSARMTRLAGAARLTVYTPGSTAGTALNVLGSLRAPDLKDVEAIRDEIEGFVSSLLVLAGIKSDPISGPEHILLASIIETVWTEGQDLDLAGLISQIQQPPFRKLGVFELDAFIPPRDRTALALKLNGLVASPSFAAWRQGIPLDIGQLLLGEGSSDSRTNGAIFFLAHLSEPERQFFVTLLLSKLVTYMRGKQGSSDLRALVYMDEVTGFCPPTAEPPSKKPILTLAKQARAFGFGMVLTTQNPMDFDYKVMSNAGTWMIGRLQTERDKDRILEGLQSASGEINMADVDKSISGLGKRQFMLYTSRGKPPRIFTTRWAMSYLAGPLTKDQIPKLPGNAQNLVSVIPTTEPDTAAAKGPDPIAVPASGRDELVTMAPAVAPNIPIGFLDPAAPWRAQVGAVAGATDLKPLVAATVTLLYDDAPAKVEHRDVFEAILTEPGQPLNKRTVLVVDHDSRDFLASAPTGASFQVPQAPISKASFWTKLSTELTDYLVASRRVRVWKSPGLKLYSRVGEKESDFRARCLEVAKEQSEQAIAKLTSKYRARIDRVRDQVATAERRVADLEADLAARKQEEIVSGAGDLLGAVLGGRRRNTITRAAT